MQLRSSWTATYVNDLPDSAFLYIAPGGSRDASGRTVPRTKRFFPVRDHMGALSTSHLASAMARIPQTSALPASARAEALVSAKNLSSADAAPALAGDGASLDAAAAAGARSRLPDDSLGMQERAFSLVMELRSSGDGRTLFGRAVPYGVTADVGQFRERFVPGVFGRQIDAGQLGQVKLFESHRSRLEGAPPVGRTLSLAERADGLYGEWSLFETSRGDDALTLVRSREVTGLSVGFTAKPGGSHRSKDGVIERHVAHLDHVVLTHEPVYADAQVLALRSQPARLSTLDAERDRLRELVRR